MAGGNDIAVSDFAINWPDGTFRSGMTVPVRPAGCKPVGGP